MFDEVRHIESCAHARRHTNNQSKAEFNGKCVLQPGPLCPELALHVIAGAILNSIEEDESRVGAVANRLSDHLVSSVH